MIDPDREALALLVGGCMGCKYIVLQLAGKYAKDPDKILSTGCNCPDRKTMETYPNSICKHWAKE